MGTDAWQRVFSLNGLIRHPVRLYDLGILPSGEEIQIQRAFDLGWPIDSSVNASQRTQNRVELMPLMVAPTIEISWE